MAAIKSYLIGEDKELDKMKIEIITILKKLRRNSK